MTASKPIIRLTVNLPTSLVDAIDEFLAHGTSRSAAVRVALERAIAEARRREEVARFVHGYEAAPQTDEEFGWADDVAVELLAEHSPAHSPE
jgi:metal-responsive CopG/Arc/MetJ family transcriptional regulator